MAADQSGTIIVDMANVSAGHNACSQAQRVNGTTPHSGAPFHPNLAGATATAGAVPKAITGKVPAG